MNRTIALARQLGKPHRDQQGGVTTQATCAVAQRLAQALRQGTGAELQQFKMCQPGIRIGLELLLQARKLGTITRCGLFTDTTDALVQRIQLTLRFAPVGTWRMLG